MEEIPERDPKRQNPIKRIVLMIFTSTNPLIHIPVAGAFVFLFGALAAYIILIPTYFLPDYVALPVAFIVGLLICSFVIGFPKKATKTAWLFCVLVWGTGVCYIYADSYRQAHHVLLGWFWVGVVLQILTVILWIRVARADKAKQTRRD